MPITFTKTKLTNGWLGNMAAFPVIYEGKTWRTNEALFQALRFDDLDIKEKIRAEKSPMTAKMVAKQNADKMTVTPMSDKDLANMEMLLRLKLEQHPELVELLKATGDDVIIEDVTARGSTGRHMFWGMAFKNDQWVGENALGKMWMKIREEANGKILSS